MTVARIVYCAIGGRGWDIAYLQLFMCFTDCLAVSFLSPVVIIFAKESHSFPIEKEQ